MRFTCYFLSVFLLLFVLGVPISTNEAKTNKKQPTTTTTTVAPGKLAVINKYWCWRARYCRGDGSRVCGRDRRVNSRIVFRSECSMIKTNCAKGNDYRATSFKQCKGKH